MLDLSRGDREQAQVLMYEGKSRDAEAILEKIWTTDAATRHVSQVGRIACALGRHKVDYWIYQSTEGCSQIGICVRCGTKGSREFHYI